MSSALEMRLSPPLPIEQTTLNHSSFTQYFLLQKQNASEFIPQFPSFVLLSSYHIDIKHQASSIKRTPRLIPDLTCIPSNTQRT